MLGHGAARGAALALTCAAIAVAVAAAVSAVRGWSAADGAGQAREAYASLQAGTAHESAFLRAAYVQPRSQRARTPYFATTQVVTQLLVRAEGVAPPSQLPLVLELERAHGAAMAEGARALRTAFDRGAHLRSALRLLSDVRRRAVQAAADQAVADVRPWPATTLQRLGVGDLALLLLAGLLAVGRLGLRATGLRRATHDGSDEIERLTHAARSDSLTGLANHRAFRDDLARAIERRNRSGALFTLLAVDLDGLKQINDVKGHQAGDAYIKTVAACIRDEVGSRGVVYRTGGDEFMALIPDGPGWHALTIAHDIQRASSRATGRRALSIGIAESTRTESGRVLLHQADLALYEAKRAKLLAVSYHPGLEPRQVDAGAVGPSQQQKVLAAALAQAVDARDAGTRNHSETVAELCAAMGVRLGLSGEALERLRIAGLLHDVGKIGVSDAVLAKRGALDSEERSEIEQHTSVGHSILTSAELHQEAVWVLHHHERFDGAGYPAGLAGEAIPLEARIIAVADAFEAMTGSRPYREALAPEHALSELAANGGTQFDPRCVEVLNELFGGDALPAIADTDDDPIALGASA